MIITATMNRTIVKQVVTSIAFVIVVVVVVDDGGGGGIAVVSVGGLCHCG